MDQRSQIIKMSPIVKLYWRIIPAFLNRLFRKVATFSLPRIVMGSKMFVTPDQKALLKRYEPGVVALMEDLLQGGMTFCDVGANIGVFTLLAARLVSPHGRVIAFEPSPENAEVLRRNLILNGHQHVDVIQKAVSDQSGEDLMYLSHWGGCHSLFPNPINFTGRMITVETVRLDSHPRMEYVDLLKIDVEGAEASVLKSLGAIRPKHIILEYNSERSKAAGLSGPLFLLMIRNLGYIDIENLDDRQAGLTQIYQNADVSVNLHLSLFF